jgi:hypothetical protein
MCDLPVGLDTDVQSRGSVHSLRLGEFEGQDSLVTNGSAFGRAAQQFGNLPDFVATLDGLLESKLSDIVLRCASFLRQTEDAFDFLMPCELRIKKLQSLIGIRILDH